MEIGFLLKVAGVGFLTAIACMILGRTGREEQATAVSIAGIIAGALIVLSNLSGLISELRGLFGF